MPINPAIALGVKGIELADPLAQYGRVAAIQQAQQQNALANMQMQEYERARQEEQGIRNRLAAGAKLEDPETFNFLLGSKSGRDILKQQADFQKAQTEEAARRAKLMADTEAMYRNMAGQISNKADAASFLQRMLSDPALKNAPITTIPLEQQIQRIPEDPQGLDNWVKQFALGTTKWITENKPVTQQINRMGQTDIVQIPGLGGRPTTVGTFADVPMSPDVEAQKARLANAGAARQTTLVNTQLPASEEAQKEFMKEMRQTYSSLKQAPTVLDNIEKAKALVPQAKGFMGAGGESVLQAASFLNNRLGTNINTQGVKSAEELRSRLFLGIMDNLKKLDSQPSQQQQAALQQALGSIGTDPTALPRVLDVFGDTIRQKVELYNEEAASAEGRGVKFPYKPTIALPPRAGAGASGAGAGAGAVPAGVDPALWSVMTPQERALWQK